VKVCFCNEHKLEPGTRAKLYQETLPWAHDHQIKALETFVEAIFNEQTGCQAQLALTQGNQEAAAATSACSLDSAISAC
jgi:hypothetical protein